MWVGEFVRGGLLDPHFININIESSLSKWVDSLILLEGEVLYSLNGFY